MSELNTAASNIYERLRSAPTFHPSSTDLFADWNVQAGDIVTVKSDNQSYQVPVYNMKMKWSGAPKVEIESTGNPEREPLPAIKRKEYASNSRGYGARKSMQQDIVEIDGVLHAAGLEIDPVTGVWLYASERGADYALGASFKVQSDAITAEVSRATAAEGTMSSRITQTANAITAEVTRATNAEGTLSGRITTTADAITAEVTRAKSAEGTLRSSINVNAEQIELRVEKGKIASTINQTAQGVTISASKIDLSGYVTASDFEATNATISNLTSGSTTATYLRGTTLWSQHLYATSTFFFQGRQAYWNTVTIGDTTITYIGRGS